MKKVYLITILLIASSFFCSCTINRKIASVQIDDTVYSSMYLYSFDNADISSYTLFPPHDVAPTPSGYTYSTEKLSSGDTIKVWGNIRFRTESENYLSSGDFGTTATVNKLIETYQIKVKEKKDTYVITYFDISNRTSSINPEHINKVEKVTIEVVKERVIINYK